MDGVAADVFLEARGSCRAAGRRGGSGAILRVGVAVGARAVRLALLRHEDGFAAATARPTRLCCCSASGMAGVPESKKGRSPRWGQPLETIPVRGVVQRGQSWNGFIESTRMQSRSERWASQRVC